MKKILSILVWVITAGGIVTLFIFSRNNYLATPLQDIRVQIERPNTKGFVNIDSLSSDINRICHIHPDGAIGTVELSRIENYLGSIPWIEESSSYIDLDGSLYVSVKEYEPVLRVFNMEGKSVYVTDQGVVIPISKDYSPRVLIASGNFDFPNHAISDSIYRGCGLADALYLRQTINKDAFLTACIGQIYRNEKGEFEIVVKENESQIIVGDTTDINGKLNKLKIFLQHKAGSEELNTFSTLNLKYKNQIVCTKRK